MTVGHIVGGTLGSVVIRQEHSERVEVGDLLVWDGDKHSILMQVFGMEHGSQLNQRAREAIAGIHQDRSEDATSFYEPDFSDYILAHAKPLAVVEGGKPFKPKEMPPVFGVVRRVTTADLSFLPTAGADRFFVGDIRSGSKVIEGAGFYMSAADVFSHHVLVPATTGRGKSNLLKCMMYGLIGTQTVGALVIDAHGEYSKALASHPKARNGLVCYTDSKNPPPGARPLIISASSVTPHHLRGVVELTEAQDRMAWDLWNNNQKEWITELLDIDKDSELPEQQKITRIVLRQKVRTALGLKSGKTFTIEDVGINTVSDIANHVAEGRIVVLDTSRLGANVEMMVGSMAASRIIWQYKTASDNNTLDQLPVATVVIEEAPRVLGEGGVTGGNPFAEIAKEGRKFKVGVCAITQLSSVIPRDIMANLNTKIIFGNEMKAERDALVGSAAQDLSNDHQTIGSLNRGEAIISSTFVPFAVPIKVPLFEDLVRKNGTKIKVY